MMNEGRATAAGFAGSISRGPDAARVAALEEAVRDIGVRLDHIAEGVARVDAFKSRILDPRPSGVNEAQTSQKEPSDTLESRLRMLVNRAQRIAIALSDTASTLEQAF